MFNAHPKTGIRNLTAYTRSVTLILNQSKFSFCHTDCFAQVVLSFSLLSGIMSTANSNENPTEVTWGATKLLSVWNEFRFSCPLKERGFQMSRSNAAKTVFAFVCLAALEGWQFRFVSSSSGVSWVTLLSAIPMCILLMASLVLIRWWNAVSPYASHIICMAIIVGVVGKMAHLVTESNVMEVNVRQSLEGISSDLLDTAIAAVERHTAAAIFLFSRPILCVLVQCLMLNGFLYTRWILLTNCALPVGGVVAIYLYPKLFPAIPALFIPLMVLWMNVLHSIAQRKQFLAESRQRETQALEAELRHAQADIESDSILNHHLKNIMAEVKGCIETFLEDDTTDELLQRALERLQSGIKWCKNRLVLIRVFSTGYIPQLTSVHLATFVEGLISGRQMPHVTFPDQYVWIDESLCALMLENVIVNALRHGHPEGPAVSLHIDLQPKPSTAEHTITFRVTNRADPAKPRITPEFCRQASEGNHHELSPSGLSDGLGLSHIFMIAKRLGTVASLIQAEGDDTVVFAASMPVRVCDDHRISVSSTVVPEQPVPSVIQQRPWNLRFCCADDSKLARRLLDVNLKRHFQGSCVDIFGATKDDLEGFVEAAMALADVVIVDQNMEYGPTTVYGTDLLKQLTALGFGGLCCIRSANTSADDRALYTSCGAHLTLDKGLSFRDMALRLQNAYVEHVAFSAPSATSGGSRSSSPHSNRPGSAGPAGVLNNVGTRRQVWGQGCSRGSADSGTARQACVQGGRPSDSEAGVSTGSFDWKAVGPALHRPSCG